MESATMTEQERTQGRLAILRDALAQVKTGRFAAGYGYLEITGELRRDTVYTLQSLVQEEGVQCSGCALGAIFVGYIINFNQVECRSKSDIQLIPGHPLLQEKLRQYFGQSELTLIENYYECYVRESDLYSKKFPGKHDRLVAILENCLRNNGSFIPSQDL